MMVDHAADDTEALLARVKRLVDVESPSLDREGASEVASILADWWSSAGADVRLVESEAGPHLVADVDGIGDPLLFVGHTDTVWLRGTLAGTVPWRVDGDVVRGPGVYDMKSGMVAMIVAVERLRGRRHRALRVVLVCDEEVGSPHSQDLLRACAEGVAGVIGFESPHPDGALKVGRRGSTRIRLDVQGRAAHAALDPGAGISAIDELVDQLLAVRAIVSDPSLPSEVLCNVGTITGGGRANVVASSAWAEIGLRFMDGVTEDRVLEALRGLHPVRAGAIVTARTLSHRPAWFPSAHDAKLLAVIARAGQRVGQVVSGRPADGAGDTNLLGSLGIPTVDGLGPRGGGAHAETEHMSLNSLHERIALIEAVLSDLD